MDERSEPTTDEIVRALRVLAKRRARVKCVNDDEINTVADRIESQQREIERLKAEMLVNAMECAERIANITAERDAEKARADAAVKDIEIKMRLDPFETGCGMCKWWSNERKCALKGVGARCKPTWCGEKGKATDNG